MIKIENLSFSFPQKELYRDITFTLEDGQHCAFIGSNGTGKSTLIHMIMDPDKFLYDGKITRDPESRFGFVKQFVQVDKDCENTVFEYLSQDFVKIQEDMDQVCADMGTAEDIEPLMERYQQILDLVQAMDGDNYESNIRKQLKAAGLLELENSVISKLSGGEFKLVQIMKEMLLQPDLLVMDEPDVFLDFERLGSLKNLINSYKGTVLVVTHNRYLLNNCFNKILHLENAEIQEFEGNYTEYNLTLLQTKIELQELAAKDTEEIERNQKLVEKLTKSTQDFANASLGRSLKARKSIVERLEARRIKAPFVDIRRPEIQLPVTTVAISQEENNSQEEQIAQADQSAVKEEAPGVALEEPAIKVTDYNISFETPLLENVNFEIGMHDKVAIVGPNGTGKTTLLNQIYHKASSQIEVNDQMEMAYLSQLQTELFKENDTVADVLDDIGLVTETQKKEYLSGFCFDDENLNSKISELSGGEKNLLQVAVIAAGHVNLLLLDEPTSHLDTYAQIELEKAMRAYDGAILMVSHDFYTIADCMDYVLLIEDKTVRKVSIRKFRKMIYAEYFDKNYLEYEQKKKEAETKVAAALEKEDYEQAGKLADQLEELIKRA